jgi:flagellar biosynthesis/type III secretory pathway protein FliH
MTSALNITLPGPLQGVTLARATVAVAMPVASEPPAAPVAAPAVSAAQAQQMQSACAALASAVRQLGQTRDELVAQAEEQLLDLAIALARKALMQEVVAGRAQIEPLLREALGRMNGRQDVTIYLHPEDLAQCPPELADGEANGFRVLPDSVVQRGQCLVESPQGAAVWSYQDRMDDLADAIKSPD